MKLLTPTFAICCSNIKRCWYTSLIIFRLRKLSVSTFYHDLQIIFEIGNKTWFYLDANWNVSFCNLLNLSQWKLEPGSAALWNTLLLTCAKIKLNGIIEPRGSLGLIMIFWMYTQPTYSNKCYALVSASGWWYLRSHFTFFSPLHTVYGQIDIHILIPYSTRKIEYMLGHKICVIFSTVYIWNLSTSARGFVDSVVHENKTTAHYSFSFTLSNFYGYKIYYSGGIVVAIDFHILSY